MKIQKKNEIQSITELKTQKAKELWIHKERNGRLKIGKEKGMESE